MVYDPILRRGVRKKYLPDPNPTKIELSKDAKYGDILQMAISLFFEEFEPTKDTLSLADSSGVPIQLSDPDNWTLGSFYQSNGLQPSRYKLYVVLKVRTFFSTHRVPSVTCPVFLLSDPNLQSNETSLSGCAANLEDREQKQENDDPASVTKRG